jgi:hypothetical protein
VTAWSFLKWCGFAAAQHDVELIAQSPIWLRVREIEFGDKTLPAFLVRDGLQDGIEGQQRIAGEIHLRDQTRAERRAKKREMDMGRTPGIVMILPWVCARPDGGESIDAMLIRQCAAGAGEVGIERRGVLVLRVPIAARGIGLPNLDECLRHGMAVIIQHPAGDYDAFAVRFS